jgi:hypothetical protein
MHPVQCTRCNLATCLSGMSAMSRLGGGLSRPRNGRDVICTLQSSTAGALGSISTARPRSVAVARRSRSTCSTRNAPRLHRFAACNCGNLLSANMALLACEPSSARAARCCGILGAVCSAWRGAGAEKSWKCRPRAQNDDGR